MPEIKQKTAKPESSNSGNFSWFLFLGIILLVALWTYLGWIYTCPVVDGLRSFKVNLLYEFIGITILGSISVSILYADRKASIADKERFEKEWMEDLHRKDWKEEK